MRWSTFYKPEWIQIGVAVAPSATFGPSGDRFVRVAFCREEAELVEGTKRLCEFINQQTK